MLLPLRIRTGKSVDLCGLEIKGDASALMEAFAYRLSEKLITKPSKLYELVTGSFIPYKIVPEKLRSKLMATRIKPMRANYDDKIELERIRTRFLETLNLGNTALNEGAYFIITHDVESEKGMERALRLKRIEDKYDIESTWFISTEEYEIDEDIAKKLAEGGDIASHGFRHDGKLWNVREGKLIEKLKQSKETLERIVEKRITGFRSPLMQYNKQLLEAISNAGFEYDSSMPTWEPVHPSMMKLYGIELINPIKVFGIIEIPVTLPQDHQMLHILGLTPKETIKLWKNQMSELAKLKGICTILVHPDYEFANTENLGFYENLLQSASDLQVPVSMNDLVSSSQRA